MTIIIAIEILILIILLVLIWKLIINNQFNNSTLDQELNTCKFYGFESRENKDFCPICKKNIHNNQTNVPDIVAEWIRLCLTLGFYKHHAVASPGPVNSCIAIF